MVLLQVISYPSSHEMTDPCPPPLAQGKVEIFNHLEVLPDVRDEGVPTLTSSFRCPWMLPPLRSSRQTHSVFLGGQAKMADRGEGLKWLHLVVYLHLFLLHHFRPPILSLLRMPAGLLRSQNSRLVTQLVLQLLKTPLQPQGKLPRQPRLLLLPQQ